jgi:hypothetical protein
MYGQQLSLPTPNEVQQAIEEYQADALLRLKHDREFPREPKQVKQGENIQVVDGQVQMNNAVSVMEVHARLVKLILKRNPKPDFYWEESYPLDLLYPHLTPHGLIFKLHHDPLPAMASSTLDADNKFWTGQCQAMVGQWLNLDTSVSNICAFAKTVYGRKDWSQFTGDRAFVTNKFAMKAYSKLRVSIAGLYHWRMTQKFKADDTARLRGEADYAFRQAYALSPSDPEVVFRYVTFLTEQSRYDDAIRLVGVAAKLSPENRLFDQLLSQLRNRQ